MSLTNQNAGPAIGRRVEAFRRLNGWTRDDLERRTGGAIRRDVIANIEGGRKKELSVTHLAVLAEAFSVEPDDLLAGSEASPEATTLGAGERVAALRKRARLTQRDLADRVPGFQQSTVAKLEAGLRPLRFSEAVAVCDALGSSLHELIPADSGLKPWQHAEVGEAWLLTINGIQVPSLVENWTHQSGVHRRFRTPAGDFGLTADAISSGRRMYPQAEPEGVSR